MPETSGRAAEDGNTVRNASAAPGVPRWVKILAVVGVAILVLIGIALASGHGPGRHVAHGVDGRTAHSGGHAAAGDQPGIRRV